jgi:CRISPR-associated protein Csd2
MTTQTEITADVLDRRYDFLYLFDVKDGNPNGDPDLANAPRFDPETFQGLVSDVCLKRKIRNYVLALKSQGGAVEPGYDVFVLEGHSLESRQRMPYDNLNLKPVNAAVEDVEQNAASEEIERVEVKEEKKQGKSRGVKFNIEDLNSIKESRSWMCRNFYDVRTFGAVMGTKGFNCGQVRGAAQVTFSRSFHRVLSTNHRLTRVCQTREKDQIEKGNAGTMGDKYTVAYGLYAAHGFINASLARQTGFSKDDLAVLWKALGNMFEIDHSAARGTMSARHCFVFEHSSGLGEAPAHKLFDLVESRVKLREGVEAPRDFSDYAVPTLDEIRPLLPAGVTLYDIVAG